MPDALPSQTSATRPRAIFNWSTGKDSALALHAVLRSGAYDVAWLLTTVNDAYDRVSMHGVRTELLRAQADALGISLVEVRLGDAPTMEAYERAMGETLGALKAAGATHSIFGDIFLEDLRAYREQRLAALGLEAVFPLWQRPTDQLAREVIDGGFTAITTCVNDRWLGRDFAGRAYDDTFLRALPADVDPCGERGEFHTFVTGGPIFSHPIPVTTGEVIHRRYGQPTSSSTAAQDEATTTAATQPQDGYTCGTDRTTPHPPLNAGLWYCDLLPAPG